MAYLRRRGNTTQLIETYRQDGKVKQRVIASCYGAASVTDAIAKLDRLIEERRWWVERLASAREKWEENRRNRVPVGPGFGSRDLRIEQQWLRYTRDREALQGYLQRTARAI